MKSLKKNPTKSTSKSIVLWVMILVAISCKQHDCSELQSQFISYQEAENIIQSTNFPYLDNCNTSKSSWILEADFYSCDNVTGYFLFKTKKNSYLHKDMPKALWIDFKKADLFGEFYNKKIKGRYQLLLE